MVLRSKLRVPFARILRDTTGLCAAAASSMLAASCRCYFFLLKKSERIAAYVPYMPTQLLFGGSAEE